MVMRRGRVARAVALLIPLALLTAAASPAAELGEMRCVVDPVVSVAYVQANLTTSDQPIDGAGRVYTFRDTDGGTTQQVITPRGFQPTSASDSELAFYGFPPRPHEPTELAAWTSDFSDWVGGEQPGTCTMVGVRN